MKVLPIALVFLIALASFIPQQKMAKNDFKKNFASLYDGLYMGKYEVSNSSYKQFLNAQKELLSDANYKSLEVSQEVFTKQDSKLAPFDKYYFEHSAYENYPVVGISYNAANAYCDWLTAKYANELVKGKHIKFSLPTKAAWQFAGNSGDAAKQFSWGTGFTKNNRGKFLANFKGSFDSNSGTDEYAKAIGAGKRINITSPVNSFFPSSAGVYNLCGNVAEMLDEEEIAAGGSFLSEVNDITLNSFRKYDGASLNIGFRVMASLY